MRIGDRTAFIIPVVLVALVLLLNLYGPFRAADNRLYDQLLSFRPEVEQDDRFVILEIDDASIAEVGSWPWSRDVLADAMWNLKELGADRVVFDIEYIDVSPDGVDRDMLENEIPASIDEAFATVGGSAVDLIESVAAGRLTPEEALEFSDDFLDLTERQRESLLDTVRQVAIDYDEYMGRAAEVFGSAFFTVTMLPTPAQIAPTDDESLEFARDTFAVSQVDSPHPLESFETIQPVIDPIASRAAGAGFTNVVVDPDGVRRRINILAEHDGAVFPQLSMAPLLDLLGNPEVDLQDSRLVLEGARMPDESEPRDVEIPLSHDGRLMVNWPHSRFHDSFRQTSYRHIHDYESAMERMYSNLAQMDQAGFLQAYAGTPPTEYFETAEAIHREIMLEGRSTDDFEEWKQARSSFIEGTRELLEGDTQAFLTEQLESARDQSDDESERDELSAILDDVEEIFAATRDLLERHDDQRSELQEAFEGAFVIAGQTGVGTVDIGVTPFDSLYFNVGTHAAVSNTILQENFLVQLPRWISLAAAVFLGLAVGFGTAKLDARKSVYFGLVSVVAIAAAGVGLFVFTGYYIPLISPLLAVALTFVGSSAHAAIRNSQERAFLRNAFSRYLSTDVISQILEDPSKLALGGEKKHMTAMFTDIQGFSTISEQLDPADLVKLLNEYLTEMSNIVLDVRGTIDKYEGDAIIAFFNAPLDDENHAANACEAAVKMKRIETDLNERFLQQRLTPNPIATRIGINSGEMVVGNMGTERQMDYTIMGHAVNLAARLEGVNKQYGSAILVSEETRRLAGDRFLFRPLDRVRVVGVNEPVQLYELLDERDAASSELIERLDAFEQALEQFRAHQFSRAGQLFSQIVEDAPNDIPAKRYAERCEKYVQNPPPADWDGVYKLSEK